MAASWRRLHWASRPSFGRPQVLEIWVGNDGAGDASVIAVGEPREVARIRAGAGHHKITVTPDGTIALVTNIAEDSVTIVDAVECLPLTTVPVVRMPHGISVSQHG